jgi:hypothetical protein
LATKKKKTKNANSLANQIKRKKKLVGTLSANVDKAIIIDDLAKELVFLYALQLQYMGFANEKLNEKISGPFIFYGNQQTIEKQFKQIMQLDQSVSEDDEENYQKAMTMFFERDEFHHDENTLLLLVRFNTDESVDVDNIRLFSESFTEPDFEDLWQALEDGYKGISQLFNLPEIETLFSLDDLKLFYQITQYGFILNKDTDKVNSLTLNYATHIANVPEPSLRKIMLQIFKEYGYKLSNGSTQESQYKLMLEFSEDVNKAGQFLSKIISSPSLALIDAQENHTKKKKQFHAKGKKSVPPFARR